MNRKPLADNTRGLPLDPIETASQDELRALQFERMKQTLAHAYQNSPVLSP